MATKIDLNSDIGESFGLYTMGNDEEVLQYVTSGNIACGYHAGDANIMRKTAELCKKYGVAIGAHPGFPDLEAFGRRYLTCTSDEITNYVRYQVGALREFASFCGEELQHVKAHGALFMLSMQDEKVAQAFLEGFMTLKKDLITFGNPNSALQEVSKRMGVPFATEGYGDREHKQNGHNLMTRRGPTEEESKNFPERALRFIKDGKVVTHDGVDIDLDIQTMCLHGDTPSVGKLLKRIRELLAENGVEVTAIKNIL